MLAAVFTAGASVFAGYLFEPAVGVVFFAAIVLIALGWDLATTKRGVTALRDAQQTGEGADDNRRGRRILFVANEAVTGDALSNELLGRGRARPVLDVVAPVLQSRSHFVTTDVDRETDAARRRLRQTLEWAAEHGIEATGMVGDAIVPLASIEDELRCHGFDEVILTTHPRDQENWLEERILDRLRHELTIPVTRVVIDRTCVEAITEPEQATPRA
jgi:hypothetical protein